MSKIRELLEREKIAFPGTDELYSFLTVEQLEDFGKIIVKDCINEIESCRIPVGNSAAGELASEWTYDSLTNIRDNIKERYGL